MNSEARALLAAQQAEEENFPGGSESFRRNALQNLKLKTVVKESHNSPVNCLSFNHVNELADARLFATVGKDQATIYDNMHMGDYIGVVVHFHNVATEFARGGELGVCAWVNADGWRPHPHGDLILAVAGDDHNISIISVVESCVISLLEEHTSRVIGLCSCADQPAALASLSEDGEVRVWDVAAGAVVGRARCPGASSICLSPDAAFAVVGTRSGAVKVLCADGGAAAEDGGGRKRKGSPSAPRELAARPLAAEGGGGCHKDAVDCLELLADGRLVSKSVDGQCHVWDLSEPRCIASWRVPSCSREHFSKFGIDIGGRFLAVGNSVGDLYIYDTLSGDRLSHYPPMKVHAPVKAVGVSPNCRHVLLVMGNGFIFRYQYLPPAPSDSDGGGGGSDTERTPKEEAARPEAEGDAAAGEAE
mmetsp:Transcript_14508/g.34437  ORF Transcript_14508/g.34437 Transcript_14508/m.34437 type:complete len:419 (+) Transcript_14508:379-1635(+)